MREIVIVFIVISTNVCGQFYEDSIRADAIFNSIVANGFPEQNNDSLKVLKGHLFAPNHQHALISYEHQSTAFLRIYSLPEPKIIYHENMYSMNFISDSLHDINGDGIKDLTIHWYPSSGCCLADIFDCYIYNPITDKLSSKTEIPNPVFEGNGIIYSLSYAHPGQSKIHHLYWQNNSIDTLNIYSWKGFEHRNWQTSTQDTLQIETNNNTIFTTEVPEEIKRLEYYEWFAPWNAE